MVLQWFLFIFSFWLPVPALALGCRTFLAQSARNILRPSSILSPRAECCPQIKDTAACPGQPNHLYSLSSNRTHSHSLIIIYYYIYTTKYRSMKTLVFNVYQCIYNTIQLDLHSNNLPVSSYPYNLMLYILYYIVLYHCMQSMYILLYMLLVYYVLFHIVVQYITLLLCILLFCITAYY